MTRANIYLCGFMSSGKTSAGEILAKITGKKFIDTDAVAEKKLRLKISGIFRTNEKKFRSAEAAVISKTSRYKNLVIALGGGALLNKTSREIVAKNGILVYIQCSKSALLRRLRGDTAVRPLLSGYTGPALSKRISTLLKKRQRHYLNADIIVPCSRLTTRQAAGAIIKKLKLRFPELL